MKNFYIAIVLVILCACNKHEYGNISGGAASSPAGGMLSIRIQNGLQSRLFDVIVHDVPFGDIEPGAQTGARHVSGSLGEASCSFTINGKILSVKSDTHSCGAGSAIATSGNYTLLVTEPSPGRYTVSASRN